MKSKQRKVISCYNFTLLQDAFSSNLNPQFEILKYIFHFHILTIL